MYDFAGNIVKGAYPGSSLIASSCVQHKISVTPEKKQCQCALMNPTHVEFRPISRTCCGFAAPRGFQPRKACAQCLTPSALVIVMLAGAPPTLNSRSSLMPFGLTSRMSPAVRLVTSTLLRSSANPGRTVPSPFAVQKSSILERCSTRLKLRVHRLLVTASGEYRPRAHAFRPETIGESILWKPRCQAGREPP
jgi:hypothetical protein